MFAFIIRSLITYDYKYTTLGKRRKKNPGEVFQVIGLGVTFLFL